MVGIKILPKHQMAVKNKARRASIDGIRMIIIYDPFWQILFFLIYKPAYWQ